MHNNILYVSGGLEVYVLVGVLTCIFNLCMGAVKALESRRICASSPEPSLVDSVIVPKARVLARFTPFKTQCLK